MKTTVRSIIGFEHSSDGRVLSELRTSQNARYDRVVLQDLLDNVLEDFSSVLSVLVVVLVVYQGREEGFRLEESGDGGQRGVLVEIEHELVVVVMTVVIVIMVMMRESRRRFQRLVIGSLTISTLIRNLHLIRSTYKEGKVQCWIVKLILDLGKLPISPIPHTLNDRSHLDGLDEFRKRPIILQQLPNRLRLILRMRKCLYDLLRFGERPIGETGPYSIYKARLDRSPLLTREFWDGIVVLGSWCRDGNGQ